MYGFEKETCRGRGLLFASGLLPAQQKQGSATKGAERSEAEGASAPAPRAYGTAQPGRASGL